MAGVEERDGPGKHRVIANIPTQFHDNGVNISLRGTPEMEVDLACREAASKKGTSFLEKSILRGSCPAVAAWWKSHSDRVGVNLSWRRSFRGRSDPNVLWTVSSCWDGIKSAIPIQPLRMGQRQFLFCRWICAWPGARSPRKQDKREILQFYTEVSIRAVTTMLSRLFRMKLNSLTPSLVSDVLCPILRSAVWVGSQYQQIDLSPKYGETHERLVLQSGQHCGRTCAAVRSALVRVAAI